MIIALTRMRRVLAADAGAGVVQAEAGTPGRLLASSLLLDAPPKIAGAVSVETRAATEAVATLGGLLATPHTGPRTLIGRRLRVLAVTLVLRDGELAELRAGAPGYDLLGRFLGSAGGVRRCRRRNRRGPGRRMSAGGRAAGGASLRPGGAEQLAAVLAQAYAADEPLRLTGRGTKLGWGAVSRLPSRRVQTSALDRSLSIDAESLSATFEAGVPLAHAHAELAKSGLMMALDPPLGAGDRAGATIGGTFATADTGPLSHRYGGAVEQVLALTVATGDGRLLTAARADVTAGTAESTAVGERTWPGYGPGGQCPGTHPPPDRRLRHARRDRHRNRAPALAPGSVRDRIWRHPRTCPAVRGHHRA